ncbi:hypothetical protein ACHAXT_002387 [Thalassiosira profunda]
MQTALVQLLVRSYSWSDLVRSRLLRSTLSVVKRLGNLTLGIPVCKSQRPAFTRPQVSWLTTDRAAGQRPGVVAHRFSTTYLFLLCALSGRSRTKSRPRSRPDPSHPLCQEREVLTKSSREVYQCMGTNQQNMISSHALLLGILQGLIAVAQSRLGGSAHQHRMLGRWTFEEPCIAGPVLYENPAEGSSFYDESLKQYHRINGRLYEDDSFTKPLSVYSDMKCDVLAPDHTICSYYLIDDTVGVFSLFSGIAKLDLSGAEDESPGSRSGRSKSRNSRGSQEKQVVKPVGTGRFVYQGGSDLHSGVLGRVSTTYGADVIVHDFCIQGSTYDHLVPPL